MLPLTLGRPGTLGGTSEQMRCAKLWSGEARLKKEQNHERAGGEYGCAMRTVCRSMATSHIVCMCMCVRLYGEGGGGGIRYKKKHKTITKAQKRAIDRNWASVGVDLEFGTLLDLDSYRPRNTSGHLSTQHKSLSKT